jgi:hypothetical protein
VKSRAAMIAEFMSAQPDWAQRAGARRDGTLLEGRVIVEDRVGFSNWFDLEFFVPASFPEPGLHPKAKIVRHDLPKQLGADAHLCVGDVLCVQMDERNEVEYRGGLLAFFEQVVIHLHRARDWTLTTKYPGPQYSHGAEGRREYQEEVPQLRAAWNALKEGLPSSARHLVDAAERLPSARSTCPCGSRVRFRDCCQAVVVQRRQRWRDLGVPPRTPMNQTRSAVMVTKLNEFLRNGGRK